MLLTLVGFSFQYEWLRTGQPAGAGGGLRGARAEPADSSDDRPGPDGRQAFSAGSCSGSSKCAAAHCGSVCSPTAKIAAPVYVFFRAGRSSLPVSIASDRSPRPTSRSSPKNSACSTQRCPRTSPGARHFTSASSARCSNPRNLFSFSIRFSCWLLCWLLACGSVWLQKSAPTR